MIVTNPFLSFNGSEFVYPFSGMPTASPKNPKPKAWLADTGVPPMMAPKASNGCRITSVSI